MIRSTRRRGAVFGCQTTFDHAAKANQSRYPWAQTIVTVVLLKVIHGRWSGVPLAFAFSLRRITLRAHCIRVRGGLDHKSGQDLA